MKRDALNEEDYDEVCRVIGDAVVVLAESGHETKREEISALLKLASQHRSHSEGDGQPVLEGAIRLGRP